MSSLGSALILTLAACGGGGNGGGGTPTPTPTPTATPTPSSATFTVCAPIGGNCDNPATVTEGVTQNFVVKVASGTPPAVNWSVNGVAGGNSTSGTIDTSGNYNPPASFDSGKPVTITATAQASASNSASATAVVVDNTLSQAGAIKLGTSGGNVNDTTAQSCCSGTLGSLIQRGGTFFILSNNHVLDKSEQGTVGDNIGQPGLVDNNCAPGKTVANLSEHAALKPASGTTGAAPSNVDASIAAVVAGNVDTTGSILDLGPVSGSSITAAPPSLTLANPATVLGTAGAITVAKSGRSSGLTCSNLGSITTTVQVDYDASCGGATAFTATFSNQIIINGGNFSAAGDSGSLIVTSDTARPLGLLYAGNNTGTAANVITDVLNAFKNGSGTPVFVGGADHAVSCSAIQTTATVQTNAMNKTVLTPQQQQVVAAVRQRHAAELAHDPAVTASEAGASMDNPKEGAILVHVNGTPNMPIPATIEGIRTRVIQDGTAPSVFLTADAIARATAIKEAQVKTLMSQAGIIGVGVGRSDDNAAETALVVYVERGKLTSALPATIDGIRTKVVEGERFRAFGWGKESKPMPGGACKKK